MSPAASRKRLAAPERREQIVSAALESFSRTGFSGTTTREIAAAAGVSEALLYRFFPDKEALYEAIIRRKLADAPADPYPREAARRGDDREVLRAVAAGMLKRMTADPSLMRLLLHSGMEGHALSASFYRLRIRETLDFLEAYLRRRMRAGAIRRLDASIVARAFCGAISHHVLMLELFEAEKRRRTDPAAFVEAVVTMTLQGLAPRPGGRKAE